MDCKQFIKLGNIRVIKTTMLQQYELQYIQVLLIWIVTSWHASILTLRRKVLLPSSGSNTHRIYRMSQEEWTKLRENVPYVELCRYNPKHLYPKLNGYGDNGHRKVWASGMSTYCKTSVTPYSCTAHARQRDTAS